MAWKKLKKHLGDGRKQNRWKSFKEKKMHGEMLKDFDDDVYCGCNVIQTSDNSSYFQPTKADGRNNGVQEDAKYDG